jgi:prolipoprotein diacylglyceryltransferase
MNSKQRVLLQAVLAGLMFFIVKLILERSTSRETLIQEGITALVFALVYGIYLVAKKRFGKKTK